MATKRKTKIKTKKSKKAILHQLAVARNAYFKKMGFGKYAKKQSRRSA